MSSIASPYYIPSEPLPWGSYLLALLMHVLLFAFFWIGIDWRSETPIAIEAEVWDMKVQQAAPKPVEVKPVEVKPEPTPPPAVTKPEEVAAPKVDIAIEQEKKKQQEKKRLDAEKKHKEEEKQRLEDEAKKKELLAKEDNKKKLQEKKRKEELEKAALEKQRAETMRSILGATGPASATGDAARSTGPKGDPGYSQAVVTKIKSNIPNINFGGAKDLPGNPFVTVKITQLPSGEVVGVKIVKSSGIPAFDAAVENAINKSSPLPRRKDGTVDREVDAKINMKE